MKVITALLGFTLAGFGMAACASTGGNGNTTANTNRSVVNSATNTVANAANTIANTVSNAASSMTLADADDFMKTAAQGGMAEVELGKLAASKATDPEVKKFGQQMVDDHGKANEELKALAAKKNVTLPTDLGSHQSDLDDLKSKSGADFDQAYVKLMLNDHEDDVDEFQAQSDKAEDADVKAFAAKTLPTLKKHLETIRTISDRIRK
jgi:putative membrane protein